MPLHGDAHEKANLIIEHITALLRRIGLCGHYLEFVVLQGLHGWHPILSGKFFPHPSWHRVLRPNPANEFVPFPARKRDPTPAGRNEYFSPTAESIILVSSKRRLCVPFAPRSAAPRLPMARQATPTADCPSRSVPRSASAARRRSCA